MKPRTADILFCTLFLAGTLFSCSNPSGSDSGESKKEAEQQNAEKFDSKESEKDAQFIVDAISLSYAGVRLSELAEQRGIDPTVKEAAIHLNKESNALISRLKEFATKRAISVPSEASDRARRNLERLTSSTNFDKDWCAQAREVNKETIDSFEKATTSLSDMDLKNWVNEVLLDVRENHDRIMACNARLK